MARQSTIRVKVIGDMASLDKSLSASGTKLDKFSSAMSKLRLPILAAGVASVKLASDFDSSMSKITGLVGIAADKVDAMGESLKGISSVTAKGPAELAEALFFVTSAGLRGADAMEALEFAAKASTAGLGETADVADALTSAMNAYAASGLSAEEATNILVATVREGKLEASELGAAIGQVLPIASEMGVTFDEVGASIAAMTRLGLNSAESVTALKSILSTIVKPAQSAAAELEKVGLSSEGLRRQLREEGLLAVLHTLREAFEGNAEGLTKVIPNVRALTGFMALTGDSAEATNQIFENLSDTTGALDTAFSVASDTIEFRFNKALTDMKLQLLEVRDPLTRFMGQFGPTFSALLGSISHEMALTVRAINAVKDGVFIAEAAGAKFADTWVPNFESITESTLDTEGAVKDFTDALRFSGGAAASTNELLQLMIESLGLGSDEFSNIEDNAEQFRVEAGLTEEEMQRLLAVIILIRKERFYEDFHKAGLDAGFLGDRIRLELNPSFEELQRRAKEAEGGIAGVSTAAQTAAENIQGLQNKIRTLTDPAFAALQAIETFEEGRVALGDAETSAESQAAGEAQLRNMQDLLFAVDELNNVSGVGIESFLFGLAAAGEVPLGVVTNLLTTLEEYDGLVLKAKLLLDASQLEAALDALRRANLSGVFVPPPSFPSTAGSDRFRAHGGPVTAGSRYVVGERGPELFVPSRSGQIIPNGQVGFGGGDFQSLVSNMQRLIAAISAGGGNTFNVEVQTESAEDLILKLERIGQRQAAEVA